MRNVLFLSLLILFSFNTYGQSIGKVFESMPNSLSYPLSQVNRLDMMDLYQSGVTAEITDMLNSKCTLENYSENYLQWKSGNNRFELILLSMVNDSKMICLVRTICGPVCESEITFYSTSWKKISSDNLLTPAKVIDFVKESPDDYSDLTKVLDISIMEYHWDPEKKSLIQQFNTPNYIAAEEKEKILPYLKSDPVELKWTGIRFE